MLGLVIVARSLRRTTPIKRTVQSPSFKLTESALEKVEAMVCATVPNVVRYRAIMRYVVTQQGPLRDRLTPRESHEAIAPQLATRSTSAWRI